MATNGPSFRRRPLPHSFHVLTDGSEYTGDGCVFLTICPTATSTIRYALSGVVEQVARLAADQKFALHSTRAVFSSSTASSSLDGLASLLLTCQQAGVEQLHVCGAMGTCRMVDGIVDTILHKKTTHPRVYACEIPTDSNEWFQVYQDEYLTVHGKSAGEGNVMLVYTLVIDESCRKSFAVVPRSCCCMDVLPPSLVGKEPLDFVLYLNRDKSSIYPTLCRVAARRILSTAPRNNVLDDGLLIRAQHYAKQRHERCSFLYPYNDTSEDATQRDDNVDGIVTVKTCCTWSLGDDKLSIDRLGYKSEIWNKCQRREAAEDNVTSPCLSRQDFYGTLYTDENEIDLDEDDENDRDDEEISSVPHLLVLGTGCATPSPQRGSSGYALLVPSPSQQQQPQLKVVMECGEGFVTSLRRHLPFGMRLEEQLQEISIIWISHAHLDHYGGLVNLLREIERARHDKDESNRKKRARVNPVLIVAPRKVLKYLQVMLNIDDNNDSHVLYEACTHQEWSQSAQQRLLTLPFLSSLQNIPVDHCPDAHGLLLQLQGASDENNNVLVVYSGDCRPSLPLVHAVHQHRQQQATGPLTTLLLHEATYTDKHVHMARSKRHATTSEALLVAKDMQSNATLLTHFSQRNEKSEVGETLKDKERTHGLCQDGLLLPLTRRALSNVMYID